MKKVERESLSKDNSHKYALVLLNLIYKNKFKNLVVADRPDLQDVKSGIGIEVTRAVSGKKIKALKDFLYGDFHDDELATVHDNMILQFKNESLEEKLNQIKKIYNQKIQKLNNGNYDITNDNSLLIYSSLQGDVNLNNLLNIFKTDKRNYNYIYLVAYDNLYEFDLQNKTYKTISYQSNRKNYKDLALKKVKFYWL